MKVVFLCVVFSFVVLFLFFKKHEKIYFEGQEL